MIVLCANCQAEDRPAFIREVPPYTDAAVSHGVCLEHAEMYRAQIASWRDVAGARGLTAR